MGCILCGCTTDNIIYDGEIRIGKQGVVDRKVLKCSNCGLERLDKFYGAEKYEEGEYHDHTRNPEFEVQDKEQRHYFNYLPSLRHKTVVDVGTGMGNFLDYAGFVAKNVIGVEPDENLRKHIPYRTYPYIEDVPSNIAEMVVSFNVIEHVEDPVKFAEEIKRVLTPYGGRAYIVTPNLDCLLVGVSEEYRKFWRRAAHNWYFDPRTLADCMRCAGLRVEKVIPVHRRGLSNTLLWLRDGKPPDDRRLPQISRGMDNAWRGYLEDNMMSERIMVEVVKD